MHEGPGQCGPDGRRRPEVRVVPLALARHERVDRVVHVVRPLRGHAVAARSRRGDGGGVVEVGLGDEGQQSPEPDGQHSDLVGQLRQDVALRVVDERVHRVEPQGVDVEVAEPPQGAVADPPTHLGAARPVEVDRGPPRRLVGAGEVGPERRQVVAGGAEVVVDDVEAHTDPAGVRGVDELLQRARPAVRLVHGEQTHAVVAPPVDAVERRDRHELDDVDPERHEVVEPVDRGPQRALRRERAHMELVEDASPHVGPAPTVVRPVERGRVEDATGAVHARRLPRAARVGAGR